MSEIWYATRKQVKQSLDFKETARRNVQLGDNIASASRSIEKQMHRRFYPEDDTRYVNFPTDDIYAPANILYLGEFTELISLTTLKSGTTEIPSTDYFLEPANEGPPFTRLELRRDKFSSFGQGATPQRDASMVGLFGYQNDEVADGTLAAAVSTTTATTIDVSDSSILGAGSLIRVNNERMNVTEETYIASGDTVQTDALTAKADNTTVKVVDGTNFNVNEVILIDAEKMKITDISGNSLIVERAQDGSVLASHAVSTAINVPRRLTVERGVLGSTAATHASGDTIERFVFPRLVTKFCIALSLTTTIQEQSGYARVAGLRNYNLRNVSQRDAIGRGLEDIAYECYTAHGIKQRKDAI